MIITPISISDFTVYSPSLPISWKESEGLAVRKWFAVTLLLLPMQPWYLQIMTLDELQKFKMWHMNAPTAELCRSLNRELFTVTV